MRKKLFLVLATMIFIFSGCVMDTEGIYIYGAEEPITLKITTEKATNTYEIPTTGLSVKDIVKGSVSSAYVVKSADEDNIIDNSYHIWISYESIDMTEKPSKSIIAKSLLPDDIATEKLYIAETNGTLGRYREENGYNRIELSQLPQTLEIYTSNPEFALEDEAGKRISTIDGYPVTLKLIDNVLVIF